MLVLLGIGFLAGIATAFTPCVVPVLPVLLAGGASGRKPFRIIAGLVSSFVVFALFAAWLLDSLGLPDDLLRNIAIGLLFLVAATLLIPQLGLLLERPFARLTRFRAGGGGFLLGASLGLVFTPCAGPVLGAIAFSAATHHVTWRAVALTLAYALGFAGPMLVIAVGGQGLGRRLRTEAPRVRFAAGLVIGLVALAIVFNLDTRFQTALPGVASALQSHTGETGGHARHELAKVDGIKERKPAASVAAAAPGKPLKLPVYGVAPPLNPSGDWFNSKPLTLAGLRGKVVLVDFWTYSCINCLRTLPHLESWYRTYHRDGLVIIGVHTPEFAFEHVPSNVGAAVRRLGIRYPVVQDNGYGTWTNFSNQYWPAHYLIDRQGRIRDYHFGEGAYDETERAIRTLLGVSATAGTVADATPSEVTTPETYLGYGRLDPQRFAVLLVNDRYHSYPGAASLPPDAFAYSGSWKVEEERIVAGRDAGLSMHFRAKDVYLVLGGKGTVHVSVGGKPASTVDVNAYKLYTLRSSKGFTNTRLDLRFTTGVQAYAFTFG